MSRVPATCPAGFQGRYTVIPGDSMFQIARRFGVTLSALIDANRHIPNPSVLFPGDVLCVPGVAPPGLPCCLMLEPTNGLGPTVRGVALILATPAGGTRVSVLASGLPAPSALGPFDTYVGELVIPAIGGGFGNELRTVVAQPPTRATGFDVPATASISGDSFVQVLPFSTQTGAQGSAVLTRPLRACASG